MSKRLTRVLSLVLTLVMFLSVSTPAFAIGGGDMGRDFGRDIGENEIRDFEPAGEITEEEELDYFQSTVTANGSQVTVEASMGALPTLAELRAETVEIEDVREAVESVVEGEANILLAMDISFWLNGIEIEPEEPVRVKISAPELEGKSNLTLVHIPDAAEPETVDLIDESDLSFALGTNEIAFQADSFSVYAVLGPGETGDNARLFVTFKQANGGDDIVMPVKKSDIKTETIDGVEVNHFEQVLYDPGVGTLTGRQTFFGWTDKENYTIADKNNALSISEVREAVKAMLNEGVAEGDTVTYYPMIFDVYNVTYLDEDGAGIRSEAVILKSGTSAEYTINEEYEPKETDSRFEGWGVASKDSDGNWVLPEESEMTKYENGATVTFGTGTDALTDDLVLRAFVPSGFWLIFKENGDGASFTPAEFYRGRNTEPPTPVPTRFGYTFGGWYLPQSIGEDGKPATDEHGNVILGNPFPFGQVLTETTRVYAKWNPVATANYTVIIWTENIACNGYDYKEYVTVENASVGNPTNVRSLNNGASVRINDSTATDMNKSYEGFSVSTKAGYALQNVTVKPEGTAVVNVYFDRNSYTFTFQANANGRFDYNEYLDAYVARTPRTTIYTVTRKYDQDISGIWEFTGSNGVTYPETNANTSWYPQGSTTYTARITSMQRMPAENITFILTHTNRTTRYFHYYIEVPDGETGTRQFQNRQFNLYKDLPNDFNVVYYNDDFWNLKGFERLAIAKSGNQVVNLSANGNISWNNLNSNYGGTDNHLYFYYRRMQYPINYMDGTYYDGDGVQIREGTGQLHTSALIDFDASIASYAKGGEDYYAPDDTNQFVFAGWYIDKTCTQPFVFDKMPMDGVTVYAKWVQKQYRVFLYPNATDKHETGVGTNDPTFESGEQSTAFRIDYNEELALTQPRRGAYEFNGWFRDKDLTQSFSPASFVANDTTVTTAYDRSESTERNDYGDVTQNINKDDAAHSDRFWITRKLELYARWRFKLIGTDGIVVEYDAGADGQFADGTKTFTDPLRYQDDADAVAQGASQATTEGLEFKRWVLQTWNGSAYVPTDTKVEPGDLFKVLATQAKIVDNKTGNVVSIDDVKAGNEYTYTVKLVAEYGSIDAPTPTHINWYSNIQDVAGMSLVVDDFEHVNDAVNTEADYATKGWVVIREPISINIGYDIEPADTYGYEDYTFLGWAKKSDAKPDELFLKWDADTGKFYAQKVEGTGDWDVEVTQVAADENQPYDDLYAIWQGEFYVYHSGVDGGNIETIAITEKTYNLTDTPAGLTENTLYGGYYLEGNFDAPDAVVAEGETEAKIPAYDGTNWTWNQGENVNGMAMTPKAGVTYYIKEVPAAKYLQPYFHYTYDKGTLELFTAWLISDVDDTTYSETGFVLTKNGQANVCASLTVQNVHGGNSIKLTPTRVFSTKGIKSNGDAFLTYRKVMENTTPMDGFGENVQIVQYWVTPDGLIVTGTAARVYTGLDSRTNVGCGDGDIAVASTIKVFEGGSLEPNG